MAHLKGNKKYDIFSCNGTMEKKLNELIIRSGIHFSRHERNVEEEIIGSEVFGIISFFRPHDIPEIVSKSPYNIGFTGFDMYREWLATNRYKENKLKIAAYLRLSGNTDKPAEIIICCRKGSMYDPNKIRKRGKVIGLNEGLIDRKGVIVHAEYPAIAKKYFKNARVVFSAGSTEAKIAKGLAHYGVVVKDTGRSLKASGLVVAKILFESPIILLAKKISPEIKMFSERLMGAIEAEKYVMLEMHVPELTVEEVLKILPAMRTPTIYKLHQSNGEKAVEGDWFSVKTVVGEKKMLDLQIELVKLGATDFVEYKMNLVIRNPEIRNKRFKGKV
jgi:ATP phosphoribosyltransferase